MQRCKLSTPILSLHKISLSGGKRKRARLLGYAKNVLSLHTCCGALLNMASGWPDAL